MNFSRELYKCFARASITEKGCTMMYKVLGHINQTPPIYIGDRNFPSYHNILSCNISTVFIAEMLLHVEKEITGYITLV